MQAPAFWFRPPGQPGLRARALAPLGALYAAATARRVAKPSAYQASVPVICIGNINVGGTGKTPTAIALASRLIGWGLSVHIVTRGYGGRLTGPVQVIERQHTAADVGDEPLLLAAFAPTWMARDRAHGVQAAQEAGAEVILLDDGFQNPSVAKDLSIVVVDAARGFGNGRVLPAGPLREPVGSGLKRADIVLSIGPDAAQQQFTGLWGTALGTLPQLSGMLKPLDMGLPWQNLPVLAFAGIGNPEKFFATLRAEGANVVRGEALEDHQPLTQALMQRLEAEAKSLNAQLVTTEKDAVRLPDSFRAKVLTMPVRLELNDWTALDAALDRLNLHPMQATDGQAPDHPRKTE